VAVAGRIKKFENTYDLTKIKKAFCLSQSKRTISLKWIDGKINEKEDRKEEMTVDDDEEEDEEIDKGLKPFDERD
jgi:hypothetical protein